MGLNALLHIYSCIWDEFILERSSWYGLVVEIISLIITLTNVRKMIIESIPTTLSFSYFLWYWSFAAYVGIKNAGLLKFSIDRYLYGSR